MKIGVGLPATIPGIDGTLIVEWAKKAETLGFSTLGIVDRVVFPNHDPLSSLAAAAAVTSKIRLMTTVLLTPLYNEVLLAKQIATISSISRGRLTMGLGIGWRKDDFDETGNVYSGRGHRFEGQLQAMRAIWAGSKHAAGKGRIGPPVKGGIEVLIGGLKQAGIERAGRLSDGFLAAPGTPDEMKANFAIFKSAWDAAGRTGTPRWSSGLYYALGDLKRGRAYMADYYEFAGAEAAKFQDDVVSSPERVRKAVRDFASIGVDELLFHPCVPDLRELDLLAEACF
ncbi:MAG: LLM class flavin-dependent oxidoreductase [SAR202 cluster bacterium]|nr:LLM class flavin-dependent oxidoreductase [SAR202 cluster bacterium]